MVASPVPSRASLSVQVPVCASIDSFVYFVVVYIRHRASLAPGARATVCADDGPGAPTLFQVCGESQMEVDAGRGDAKNLTTAEREELGQLCRENRQLRMEREILKKATAFFAKEST